MQVNICTRLIDKMIKNGHKFVNNRQILLSHSLPLGIYTTQSYKPNEILRVMSGKMLNIATQNSIHIGDNMHLEDEIGKYINHSFEPNIKIVGNKLVAIKYINIYDEITFNYNENELEIVSPFEDNGIKVCGKIVKPKL